jgi:hypothetical protein
MIWAGHHNFGNTQATMGVKHMSDTWTHALWCDVGEHPFGSKDPDKHSFAETRTIQRLTGNSYGNPVYQDQEEETDRITICGPCFIKQRPFQKSPAQIPAGVDRETYTQWLEEKAGLNDQPTLDDLTSP